MTVAVPKIDRLEVGVEDVHLAIVVVEHCAVKLILGLLAFFDGGEFDEKLGNFVALEDEHFADPSVRAEFLVDEVVCELEDHGIVDADEQHSRWLLGLDRLASA